jgi:drug/metabolite transporter (DMT)-like permease
MESTETSTTQKPIGKWAWGGAALTVLGVLILLGLFIHFNTDLQRTGVFYLAKHCFATGAASLAVVASVLQAKKAKEKARDKNTGSYDQAHFNHVGTLWYVLFWSGLAAVIAEGIDFFI